MNSSPRIPSLPGGGREGSVHGTPAVGSVKGLYQRHHSSQPRGGRSVVDSPGSHVSNHITSQSNGRLPAKPIKLKAPQLRQLNAQILACKQLLQNRPCDPHVLKGAQERVHEEPEIVPIYQIVYNDVDPPPESVVPMPASIDVLELAGHREQHVEGSMAARQCGLEALDPDDLTPQERLSATLEIRALSLAELQSKTRHQLLQTMHTHCTLETQLDPRLYRRSKSVAIQTTAFTDTLEKRQRHELERRRTRKHREFLESVLHWGREFASFHQRAREGKALLARTFVAHQQRVEQERKKKAELAERERLRALMEDNEEEYRKLVKEKKDERLNILLEETDKFVKRFADLVRTRRERLKTTKGSVEAEKEAKKEEEEVIQSIVNGDDTASKTYYLIAHTLGEKIAQQPEMCNGGQLKQYQMQGLEWMVSLYNNKLNGILADEMGLGKTIQTIALLAYLIEKKQRPGPFLIAVPLSTMTNWQFEFAKWAPAIDVVRWEGKPRDREQLAIDLRSRPFHVLLTSYEYIMLDKSALCKFRWVYLIVDEGHRIKNEQAKLTKILNKYYRVDHRLLLTGTPLQNKLQEMWALMGFLMPDIFNKEAQSFDEWLAAPFAGTGMKPELNAEEKMLVMGSLHKVLRPFILKRMKSDVAQQLPQKTEYVVRVKMSALQESVYRQVKENGLLIAGTTDGAKMKALSNVEMHLRKILNHPYLFKEIEAVVNPTGIAGGPHLIRTCGKFELLDRVFTKLKESGHRVLLFCQMTSLLDILEDFLTYKGLKYIRLDGSTCAEDRGHLLQQFNAPGSDIFVFLLSTRAGGLGLNLQSADTVILYDSDWNPFQDLQAQDRAHRIGQKNEVRVIRLVTVGGKARTVEECILEVAQKKLHIDAKVIQAGRFDNRTSAEERRRILEYLVSRDDELEQEDEDRQPHTAQEVNEMLARDQDELDLFEQIDEQMFNSCGGEANRLMRRDEVPEVYIESGEKLEQTLRKEEMAVSYGRGRRERKEITYSEMLDDDTWARALDEGMLEEVLEQKRQRVRAKERRANPMLTVEPDSGGESVQSGQVEGRKRGRGRPRKLLDVEGETDTATSAPTTPKSRQTGRRSMARSQLGSDDEMSSSKATGSSKRGKATEGSDEEGEGGWTQQRMMHYVLDKLTTMKDGDTQVAKIFMRLPKRNEYPDYYEIIKDPISFAQIRNKIHKSYQTLSDMEADLELMWANARAYNEESSWVVRHADLLKEEYKVRKNEVMELAAKEQNTRPQKKDKGEEETKTVKMGRPKRRTTEEDMEEGRGGRRKRRRHEEESEGEEEEEEEKRARESESDGEPLGGKRKKHHHHHKKHKKHQGEEGEGEGESEQEGEGKGSKKEGGGGEGRSKKKKNKGKQKKKRKEHQSKAEVDSGEDEDEKETGPDKKGQTDGSADQPENDAPGTTDPPVPTFGSAPAFTVPLPNTPAKDITVSSGGEDSPEF